MMYEGLVNSLRCCAAYNDDLCSNCKYHGMYVDLCYDTVKSDAADVIEKLDQYAAQMDKLREDGWYLLQETAGTYGPITMKMPIPEPLSCKDVLAIINGEPPEEGEI